MGQPAARSGDQVVGTDTHIVMVPSAGGPVPTPLPHPFSGSIVSSVSSNVMIEGMPAATVGSVAQNTPPHLPTPPGASFQVPPTNQGTVMAGSASVMINGKPAARMGDQVQTCNDPSPAPVSRIAAGASRVTVG